MRLGRLFGIDARRSALRMRQVEIRSTLLAAEGAARDGVSVVALLDNLPGLPTTQQVLGSGLLTPREPWQAGRTHRSTLEEELINLRLQEAIRQVFARFRLLGSARQVLLSLTADGLCFPRPSDGKRMTAFEWTPIRYRNVISLLKNPFYAGAYAYGKSEKRTAIVDGRAA